jgi:hypothetical protein
MYLESVISKNINYYRFINIKANNENIIHECIVFKGIFQMKQFCK